MKPVYLPIFLSTLLSTSSRLKSNSYIIYLFKNRLLHPNRLDFSVPSLSSTLTSPRKLSTMTKAEPHSPSLPIIDFSSFSNAETETKPSKERLETSQALLSAFKEVGFVYLQGHGIDESVVKEMFTFTKKFFDLPVEEKEKLNWTSPESNRGYVCQGREKTSRETDKAKVDELRSFPDLKESFEIGKEPSTNYQNNWPEENLLPGFRETNLAFYQACHSLFLKIMSSLALGLGLEESYFEKFCNGRDHNLRLLHYPEVRKSILDREEQSRTGTHTDYGALTLLFQDNRGGLEVKNIEGTAFIPAPPIPDTIIINAGDLLARWSNDVIKSTEHRVVSPPLDLANAGDMEVYPARYSIPFFCNPNFDDQLIECLEVCKGKGAKYAPIKSFDHLVERLATTYN